MNFVWIKDRKIRNCNLTFSLDIIKECDTLTLCAVDFYQVYIDGKFNCYGPERTASGYSRKRVIDIKGAKRVDINVSSYGVDNYSCDRQLPFFGAELTLDNKTIYNSFDFACSNYKYRLKNVPKYSSQRGFTEWYDYFNENALSYELFPVESPIVLDGLGDTSKYLTYNFTKISDGVFEDFDITTKETFELLERHRASDNSLLTDKDFLGAITNKGYEYIDFILEEEKTGFISLKIQAETPTDVYVCFEEILVDGKWNFRRTSCNDYIVLKNVKGNLDFLSFEPYVMKHLKVISSKKISVTPSIVGLENNSIAKPKLTSNPKINAILNSAHNTLIQNAVDIFTDCPGRERAGWLCDSYFMGISEHFFTGNNDIERNFLENIILSTTPELPKGMLPKCFPSEHYGGMYIPNWAMWFIVELKSYLSRTNDASLINLAKDKVYGVIEFFKDFENEHGLLEDLQSWVFIEWSICNNGEYIKGVNFPSNMIYAHALSIAGEIYNDDSLIEKAKKLKETIYNMAFNGEFFADNAVRVDGKLIRQDNHVSETCQYYALFTNVISDKEYINKMITEFGPTRDENSYKEIGRSNVFIGNYLRFLWLLNIGEKRRILDESVDYFYQMANKTGTLWEKDTPTASCNHGFASVIAYIYYNCL